MRVFVFDLLPYRDPLDKLEGGGPLPYPLGRDWCKPEAAARGYAEHLDAWEEIDRLGYDGVGFNEHHTSPFGMMNSPNLMAAAAAQRTKRMKLLIYGNLLPLHNPLRLAEELAMVDCLSNGRLICGFARGIPREYSVYNMPMAESRARFEEAYEVVVGAWTEDVFSFDGKFYHYKDVALWPRPIQRPTPPVWVPVTSSKETIEWAGARNIPITPGDGGASPGFRADIIRHYARHLAKAGHRITPDHLSISVPVYVADSKAQALKEAGPYGVYFNRCLFNHGSFMEASTARSTGFASRASLDYVRPENLESAERANHDYRNMTIEQFTKRAEHMAWGSPDEVAERIIAQVDSVGAGAIDIRMNTGSMPHEMFIHQIRRFAAEVLPRLQAHKVTRVPAAEGIEA